jgi:hypothetical protein
VPAASLADVFQDGHFRKILFTDSLVGSLAVAVAIVK